LLTGTWPLIRLILRRDRWLIPAWIVALAGMAAVSANATIDLYPSEQDRIAASETINATGALVAMYGAVYDPTSIGALSLIKLTAFGSAIIGVVFVFLVVRHTRTDEEAGRLELLSAGVVGRAAPLTAALTVCMASSLLLGAATSALLIAVGLPTAGSVAFGLSWALAGIVFSAAAGVAAQIAQTHRVAIGLGVAAVAAAYLLRAVGDLVDSGPSWLSWLSPIGWSQQIRPFAGDRWWVAVIPVLATLVLVPLANALRAHRDLGSGLLPDRLGPATGRLGTVGGLAWRLQRGQVIAWAVGVTLMGFVLGSVAENVTGFVTSDQMRQYIELLGGAKALVDAFLAAEISILGTIVGLAAIAFVGRLRSEESSDHTELLLATGTSRLGWASSHIVLAVLAVTGILALAGAAIGLGHGLAAGGVGTDLARMAGAALGHVPPVLVMVGLVVLLFGWLPRATPLAWGIWVAFLMIGELGGLLKLPQWVMDLSPFAHAPKLPGSDVDVTGILVLLVIALAMIVVGLIGWRRRDLRP
jgi:ABC-2 type transport system permease protein